MRVSDILGSARLDDEETGEARLDFPASVWGDDDVAFVPAAMPPDAPCAAVLLFPFYGDRLALADNVERGWCIPAGGIEAGEAVEAALHREAMEEAGLTVGKVACIGYYILRKRGDWNAPARLCPTFIGDVLHIGDWTDKVEVRAVQLMNIEDVAELYYRWDTLMAAVFEYADNCRRRTFTVGVSLSDFMREA